jgi:glycosyltransferase involved in cell wall biosynthesis
MIFLFHKNNKVVRITKDGIEVFFQKSSIGENLILLAKTYENEEIVWCHSDFEVHLNLDFIRLIEFNPYSIQSFNPHQNNYLNSRLGYIDQNSILKVNKNLKFQTWQLNASVGIISTTLLQKLEKHINVDEEFNYLLNSLAKRTFMNGVLCYSEPNLFLNLKLEITLSCDNYTLFQFVKQHYQFKWLFILLLNIFLYERKLLVLSFLKAFFYRRKPILEENYISEVFYENKDIQNVSVDIIIPTIGRSGYLRDFLKDLKRQELLPKNVIIVEQNPNLNSVSELDYIHIETWPFKIVHQFIHQSGACNARNLALQKVTSDWVFFADDDIRIASHFLKDALFKIQKLNINAVLFSCLLKTQKKTFLIPHQTTVFGSGCTIVNSEFTSKVLFDIKYEFCFGEDSDYGMKIRNMGADVIYLPEPSILHLKAPIGGFRTKPTYLWSNEKIMPKPSPTIILNLLRYSTKEQQFGFKTLYFIKSLNWKNPFQSFKEINKHWNSSLFWANKLKNM